MSRLKVESRIVTLKLICFAGCWNEGTSAEIDALAMGRCEKMRQQSQGSNPTKNSCKVFARDNNIIWNKKTYESLELE